MSIANPYIAMSEDDFLEKLKVAREESMQGKQRDEKSVIVDAEAFINDAYSKLTEVQKNCCNYVNNDIILEVYVI